MKIYFSSAKARQFDLNTKMMKYNYILTIFLIFSANAIAQNVILNDNFEEDNFNLISDSDNFKVSIDSKGLLLENNHEKNAKWKLIDLNKELDFVDFDVEAKITLIKSDSEKSGYGLVWACYNDYSNYHVVSLNEAKKNLIYWNHNKKYTYDLNWTENDNIKSKRENTIKVSRRAQNVTIYINDEEVLKTNNTAYYGDKFGFILDSKMTIKVTNLKITEFPLSVDVVDNFDASLKVEKLPETISSENYTEKNPVIALDGKTLYFDRQFCDLNIEDAEKSDAWFSVLENDEWSIAQNMGRPINNKEHNFVISVSPDNNRLLVGNTYAVDGINSKGSGVSITYRKEDGWEIPKEIKIKDYVNKNEYVGYFLANDNMHLLMSVERKEGFGSNDIYVSFLEKDGSWSKPSNLGNIVNTSEPEENPFLASDGKTLYFSSKGHPGYGGYDLFVTKRLDDTWLNWSKPKNLGNRINTSKSELSIFLSAKGDIAYLGRGKDLYKIKNTVKQEPVVLIKGKVYDSKTGKVISAPIFYNDLTTSKELGLANSEPKEGNYSIVLPTGEKYSFMAEKEGYYGISENIDLSELEDYKEIMIDLYLDPIEKGQTIRLNNIFFASGEYSLLTESNAELDKLMKILSENKELKIEIIGHTDATGEDNDNLILSKNRANTVMDFLLSEGVAKERLTAKGYGEKKFIAPNDTEEGKQQNRRVEFKIIKM